MKKLTFLCFTIIICVFLCSCGTSIEKHGLENFGIADSSESLCSKIIPEDFINMFEYENGDYYYSFRETFVAYESCDKAILYFQYDTETYVNAKAYAMENLSLSHELVAKYNNYYFYDNYNVISAELEIESNNYPYYFVRFAYNDEKQILVFIGFSVSMELYDEVDEVSDDFGQLLERYFGEYYSFE